MRATEIWQKALREYEAPETDPAVAEQMASYVAKRKELIGSAEPVLEPTPLS